MPLSNKSIEALLDLIEIKLSYIEVSDREDAREVKVLQRARAELRALAGLPAQAEIVPLPVARQARAV